MNNNCQDPSFFIFPELDNGKAFNQKLCKRNCGCGVDYIDVLVAGYQVLMRDPYERCLDRKWNIRDCVSGCHTCDEDVLKEYFKRNSHQYRLKREAIIKAEEALNRKVREGITVSTFEELFDQLSPVLFGTSSFELTGEEDYEQDSKETDGIDGIGELATYDTILRFGWHYAGCHIAPQAKVYLHAGVYLGAYNLARISEYTGKKYIDITPVELKELRKTTHPLRVDIRKFSHTLRLLGACHLENFLCCFHNLLAAYADFLEKKAEEKSKRKTNQSK